MCYTRPVESIENKLRCKHHLSRRNRKCLQNYIVCESKKIIIKLYRVIDCIENWISNLPWMILFKSNGEQSNKCYDRNVCKFLDRVYFVVNEISGNNSKKNKIRNGHTERRKSSKRANVCIEPKMKTDCSIVNMPWKYNIWSTHVSGKRKIFNWGCVYYVLHLSVKKKRKKEEEARFFGWLWQRSKIAPAKRRNAHSEGKKQHLVRCVLLSLSYAYKCNSYFRGIRH